MLCVDDRSSSYGHTTKGFENGSSVEDTMYDIQSRSRVMRRRQIWRILAGVAVIPKRFPKKIESAGQRRRSNPILLPVIDIASLFAGRCGETENG